jgi:hypothetical protein
VSEVKIPTGKAEVPGTHHQPPIQSTHLSHLAPRKSGATADGEEWSTHVRLLDQSQNMHPWQDWGVLGGRDA